MPDDSINIYELSEADIRTKYITPAIENAGWDVKGYQVREEYSITAGTIKVQGQTCRREKPRKADYVLFSKPNKPIAVIEAKDANHPVGGGMQQALEYAAMLDVPFVFSSNGQGFLFHNRYAPQGEMETALSMDNFPSPETLWEMYCQNEGYTKEQLDVINQPYYTDNPNKQPRYYQLNAINKTVEAIAAGKKNRFLLVMATGTGKTYTAFQIIWRLWKSGLKKRILFLADRRALINQTFTNDFAPLGDKMTVVNRNTDKSYEIYLALYQGLTGDDSDSEKLLYEKFSPGFFDLIIIDECHRGSAKANSQWREILEYYSSATQIGLTATPKETRDVSTTNYFGDPVYTYSLKQGIEDGFLAPYRVFRYFIDKDIEGFTPADGQIDDRGEVIENRVYNVLDFDSKLVLDKRTKLIAKTVSDYLKKHNCRNEKTIFFCIDQEHAARMRQALVNENSDLCAENPHYVMRITANDEDGVKELDNFRDPEKPYPTLVTTSKLLSTGVDIKTLKNVVLDSNIGSMSEFKQIIGRGTRIYEDGGKLFFTIFDFRNVTKLFFDPDFDGPIQPDPNFDPDNPPPPPSPSKPSQHVPKYYLGETPVEIVNKTVQYMGENGKLVTIDVVDFTRQRVQGKYASLSDFLNAWNAAERKLSIVDELLSQGVFFDELKEEVGKDLDPFDLILHIVFDQPALTRKERAENDKKRNYFTKYGPQAQAILNALLTKYADSGLEELENENILRVDPISSFGAPYEIVTKIFGGREQYFEAIETLKKAIYAL